MNSHRHRLIISFVSITIVATIAVQVYWNYISYRANKDELINQVQVSLDNAVDTYYAHIARGHSLTLTTSADSITSIGAKRLTQRIDSQVDSMNRHNISHFDSIMKVIPHDSIIGFRKGAWSSNSTSLSFSTIDNFDIDQLVDTSAINLFATKIFVSMRNNELDFTELSNLIEEDFANKNWPIDFGLLLRDSNCGLPFSQCDTLQVFRETHQKDQLMVASKSAFIPNSSDLEIHFSNISSILLKRSFIGIVLSLLLSGAIIFCLLYLIKTINQQKQLAEIKNDLISNITHEFKTPITTIGTALEGIENFSGFKNLEKTKKYLGISNGQLSKLNIMVEKLLETASIDSEHLELNVERTSLTQLIDLQLGKYRIAHENKSFNFETDEEEIISELDTFHIESAIGNLLDNAVKYGGEVIEIILNRVRDNNTISIQVIDNGSGIAKDQRTKIFDKFYRVSTGNIHDVKGFGIGLYYARNIIEKHGGSLELIAQPSKTNFNITLPYAN